MATTSSGMHGDGSAQHPPTNLRETASREFFENFARLRGAMDHEATATSAAQYQGTVPEGLSMHSSPSRNEVPPEAHVTGSILPGSMHSSHKTISNSHLARDGQQQPRSVAPHSVTAGSRPASRHSNPAPGMHHHQHVGGTKESLHRHVAGALGRAGVSDGRQAGGDAPVGSMAPPQPSAYHHPQTSSGKTGTRTVDSSSAGVGMPTKERRGRPRRGDGNTLAIKLHSTKEDFDELAEVVVELDNADQVVEKMLETLAMKFPPESVMTIAKGGRVDSDEEDESVYSSQGVGEEVPPVDHGPVHDHPPMHARQDDDGRRGLQPGESRILHSSIIGEETGMGTEPRIRYVEVPVYEEVIRRVPKKEYVEIEKRIPKYEVEWVEKYVEIPDVRYIEKHVEIEKVEEIVKQIPRKEYVDVPKEVIKHVPKIITEMREKIVEVPGEVIEVPKPYQAENRVPRPLFRDTERATVVAQTLTPVLREDARVKRVDMTTYEPRMIPVDVFVPVPVKLEIEAVGKATEAHNPVDVPAAQWNSITRKMNEHLSDEMQLLMKMPDWSVPFMAANERVDIVHPRSDDWRKYAGQRRLHCTEGTPTTETELLQGPAPPSSYDDGRMMPRGMPPPNQFESSSITTPAPQPPQRHHQHGRRASHPNHHHHEHHHHHRGRAPPPPETNTSMLTSEPAGLPPVMPYQRVPQPTMPQQRTPPPNTAMMVAHGQRSAGFGAPAQQGPGTPPVPGQFFQPPMGPPMAPPHMAGAPGAFGQAPQYPAPYGMPRSIHDSMGSIPMHAQMMPPWLDPYAAYGYQGRGGSAGSISGSTRSRSTPRGGACAPKKKPKRYSSQDMKKQRPQGTARRPRNVPLFP
eukprot:Polyplicarium_translucidae@DN949_c0_g1_i1.p1